MAYDQTIGMVADGAAIVTALIAAFGYGRYLLGQRRQRLRLERHLKDEKLIDEDRGRCTVLDLMGQLAMTESEILSAAFRSKKVRSSVTVDSQGRSDTLLFEYVGADLPQRRRF